MIRLWNLLIYGEWEASKWEIIKTVNTYAKDYCALPWEPADRLIEITLLQRNQYGRIRRVRI